MFIKLQQFLNHTSFDILYISMTYISIIYLQYILYLYISNIYYLLVCICILFTSIFYKYNYRPKNIYGQSREAPINIELL